MIKKIVKIFDIYEDKIDFVNSSDVVFSCLLDCNFINL